MRILVVEDQEPLANRIKDTLANERYQVDLAFDGDAGLERALLEDYDLVVLDILLPGLDGIEVLKQLRESGTDVPVLMLTVKDQVQDKVAGLDAGADDYLTKPFATPELLARIRSLLRRKSDAKDSILTAGDLSLDTNLREVTRGKDAIELTPKEYSILQFLMYNKNRVLSRLAIAEHVWGDNFDLFSMTNFVDVHVKNLRKKINDDGPDRLIQTVRGVGYTIKDG
jgi:DNA-binding response OmpR family regulator